MKSWERPAWGSADDNERSSCSDDSDGETYSSDEEEYEIPECFCGKDAKLRISFTDKNWMRPFFNCPKRNFNTQCGFFVWKDELFDEDSDQSSEESSYVCDECLAKEQEFGEVESAKTDDKVYVKQEPLESEFNHSKTTIKVENVADDKVYLGRVKQEPLESEFNHSKTTIKVENVADDKVYLGRVKQEPLESEFKHCKTSIKVENVADDKVYLGGVKQEPLESEFNHSKTTIKVENVADDVPLFGKVKVEPVDQDGNERCDEADSVCGKCCKRKHKIVEIQSAGDDDKASWDKEKLERLTKLGTVESELGHIKKKTKLANEGVMVDKWKKDAVEVESVFCQIETKTELANEVDDMPLLDKLSNPKDEIVESEIDKAGTETKFVKQADHLLPSDKLTKSEDETAESASDHEIEKKSKLVHEADDMPSFDKLSNLENNAVESG